MLMTSIVAVFAQLLLAATPAVMAHPHHPRAIKVGGAGGDISVIYFTVPFNEKHFEGLTEGFEWHLGFALLDTEVPLVVGNTTVPPGKYKLQGRLGAVKGEWDLVLKNQELARAEMGVFFAEMRGGESTEAVGRAKKNLDDVKNRLAETGDDKAYVLKATGFKQDDEEHLRMTVINHGFVTAQRMSDEPAGGVEFELRISYGDLHRTVSLGETFPVAKDK